jgi:hypothetical protein
MNDAQVSGMGGSPGLPGAVGVYFDRVHAEVCAI